MQSDPSAETRRFLELVYSDALDLGFLLPVWSLPSKRTAWCKSIDEALTSAISFNENNQDVYVGVGLTNTDLGARRRGFAKDVVCLIGLWADIDVQHDVHKKKNLAPDIETAIAIVSSRAKPSIIVNSGHGIQAWWLFIEPWVITDASDHKKGSMLAEQWTRALMQDADARSVVIDATQDISRVLRVPGTFNRKDAVVPVEIIAVNDVHYDPVDFDALLPEETAASKQKPKQTHTDPHTPISENLAPVGQLEISADCSPPFEKFDAMMNNDDKFKRSWEHKRRDLKDQSASSYDLSLATLAVMAGWRDQEIACLLISHRRKHSEDLKLREDYYARTIARARDGHASSSADDAMESMLLEIKNESFSGTTNVSQEQRDICIDILSVKFGIPLRRVVQYVGHGMDTSNSEFHLVDRYGRDITVGAINDFMSQTRLHNVIAEAWGQSIPRMKESQWDGIKIILLRACEKDELQLESSTSGQIGSWLSGFIADRGILPNLNEATGDQLPFRDVDGRVCIFGPEFRRWLKMTQMENITQIKMGTMLRHAGCVSKAVPVELGHGVRTTRGVWVLPNEISGTYPPSTTEDNADIYIEKLK